MDKREIDFVLQHMPKLVNSQRYTITSPATFSGKSLPIISYCKAVNDIWCANLI